MPYLSRDWRRAEGGEGDVDNGVDDEHIDGRVQGPRLADTGNGQRRRFRHDGDNDDDVKDGGSHPTNLQTTVMRELAERLHSASRDRQQAGGGEGNVDNGGNNEHVDGHVWGLCRADTGDGQQWRSQGDSDNDDDVEEGVSHPTLLTIVTRELAERLRSTGISYASEASLSDVDNVNRR